MAKAGLLFVGTDDGVVLFSNPGAVGRWLRVGHELRGKAVGAVWARPDNPLLVLAACGPDGLWRSADGGQSWAQTLETPSIPRSGIGDTFAVLGGNEPTLLAASSGLYRSPDNGATWQPAAVEPPLGGDVSVIVPASYHIDTAFAGTEAGQVYITTDRGRSWLLLKDGLPPVRAIGAARLA
ncbi:MAG: hypothetical protein RLZZ387_2113 [Chloroflexota bacterium]|jgi:hypothetical protein